MILVKFITFVCYHGFPWQNNYQLCHFVYRSGYFVFREDLVEVEEMAILEKMEYKYFFKYYSYFLSRLLTYTVFYIRNKLSPFNWMFLDVLFMSSLKCIFKFLKFPIATEQP